MVKSHIIIIVMNIDKKIIFLFKIYKNSKIWRILEPVLCTETY